MHYKLYNNQAYGPVGYKHLEASARCLSGLEIVTRLLIFTLLTLAYLAK